MRPSIRQTRCVLVVLLALAALTQSAAGAPLLWKTVANAFLRVNDEGVKEWGAFQIEKKDDRFLLQLADRFLLVDMQQKQVFELAPADVARNDSGLLWDPANKPAKPLATSEWLVRDVGLAQRIRMRLNAENRTLDLQIPHRPSRP
jgi:hypothetical protein